MFKIITMKNLKKSWNVVWKMTWGIYGKFSPEQFKVSKLGYWCDPLIQSTKSMSLKSTEELCIMTMKNDAKFEEELTFWVISKLTWGIWWILTWALESLKNFHFNVLLLNKIYIVWAKKVQRSYLSRNWKGIQNLERNRLVVS